MVIKAEQTAKCAVGEHREEEVQHHPSKVTWHEDFIASNQQCSKCWLGKKKGL